MGRLKQLRFFSQNIRAYRFVVENDILKDNDITGSPLFHAVEDKVILGFVQEKTKIKQPVPKKKEVKYTNTRYKHAILGPWLQIESEKD
jgi:hypothetical protein